MPQRVCLLSCPGTLPAKSTEEESKLSAMGESMRIEPIHRGETAR